MAKKSIIKVFPEPDVPFDITGSVLLSATEKKVVSFGGAGDPIFIIYEGKDLEVSGGLVVSGTITDIIAKTVDGQVYYKISGISVNAGVTASADMETFFNDVLARALFEDNKFIDSNEGNTLHGSYGNDLMLGRGGDDTLGGSYGKDVLAGGGGEDIFVFEVDMGKDTIRDFDADGTDGAQDAIQGVFADATIVKSGKNTVVDFGDGDAFLLLGIKPSEIDATDFT